MNPLLWNILLAIAWAALTGSFTPINLTIGFALGYGVLVLTDRALGRTQYLRRAILVISFAGFFAWELFKSNLRVAYDVLSPRPRMRPGVVAIPLDVTRDIEITLLANLITLTPGTLSLDVSSDNRVLYIHSMYVDDVAALRREIKEGFERRVMEVMR